MLGPLSDHLVSLTGVEGAARIGGQLVGRGITGGIASKVIGGKFEDGFAEGVFEGITNAIHVPIAAFISRLLTSPAVVRFLALGREVGAAELGILGASASSLSARSSKVADVLHETLFGRGNFESKYVLTSDEALRAAESFLGRGYKEIGQSGSGVFRSADGIRQFRMDNGSLLGVHAPHSSHVHLEYMIHEPIRCSRITTSRLRTSPWISHVREKVGY